MGVIKTLLSLLANVFGFLKDRQLINAGKAEAERDATIFEQKRVEEATAARADSDAVERMHSRRFRD